MANFHPFSITNIMNHPAAAMAAAAAVSGEPKPPSDPLKFYDSAALYYGAGSSGGAGPGTPMQHHTAHLAAKSDPLAPTNVYDYYKGYSTNGHGTSAL